MYGLADCNNFFASCERVFRPDLRDKPVIVLSNNDGCAIARSNEAKALGIKMGDPLFKIKDIVEKNSVAVFSGNMALYGDMSSRVREVLATFAPSLEIYSIDEAFLDLEGINLDFDAYAKQISKKCWQDTSIPVSVGIAPTKTLAKIASKLCKKYPKLRGGCYMHRREDIEKVLRKFAIEDVWGIGRRSVAKLHQIGVTTAYDFTQIPEAVIQHIFGITGLRTQKELKGIPCIDFECGFEPKQSICVSRSFATEIYDIKELQTQIANFASSVAEKLRKQSCVATEIAIFAYTNRFKENCPQTFSNILVPLSTATADSRVVVGSAVQAIRNIFRDGYGYKKAGVIATKIIPQNSVMHTLFEDISQTEKEHKITKAIDDINKTFGKGTIKIAVQGSGVIKATKNNCSPHYTTRWADIPTVTIK